MRTVTRFVLAGVAATIPVLPCANAVADEPHTATAGTGWVAETDYSINSISPDRQYTITFTSAALKAKYAPYLVRTVDSLRENGVRIAIGNVTSTPVADCPAEGVIQFSEAFRPLNGQPGMSRTLPCHGADDSAWGGHVVMDSEYWDGWNIDPHTLLNTFPHELMHALGMGHPNHDMNGDGKVDKFECDKRDGATPAMCSPNGGSQDERAGVPTGMDLTGVRQMLKNFNVNQGENQ